MVRGINAFLLLVFRVQQDSYHSNHNTCAMYTCGVRIQISWGHRLQGHISTICHNSFMTQGYRFLKVDGLQGQAQYTTNHSWRIDIVIRISAFTATNYYIIQFLYQV